MQDDVEIQCPFCGETIPLFIDASLPDQKYIEDCSVCCRPIEIHVTCEAGVVQSLDTSRT